MGVTLLESKIIFIGTDCLVIWITNLKRFVKFNYFWIDFCYQADFLSS